MHKVSDEQVKWIESELLKMGLDAASLLADLTDHICCLIENDPDGENFEESYARAIAQFGEHSFAYIQHETNIQINQSKIKPMKTTLKTTGILASLLIVAGALFKFFHLIGANALFVSGTFILATVFFPILFILKYRIENEERRNLTLTLTGIISTVLLSASFLFRMMFWPYHDVLMMSGLSVLVLGYFPVYLIHVYKSAVNKIVPLTTLVLLISGSGLFFAASNTGMSRNISENLIMIHETLEKNSLLMENKNREIYQQLKQEFKEQQNLSKRADEIKERTAELISFLNEVRMRSIADTEEISEEEAKSRNITSIKHPGENKAVNKLLSGDKRYSMEQIEKKVKAFTTFTGVDVPPVGFLNAEQSRANGHTGVPLAFFLHHLRQLEYEVRMAELTAYCQLR